MAGFLEQRRYQPGATLINFRQKVDVRFRGEPISFSRSGRDGREAFPEIVERRPEITGLQSVQGGDVGLTILLGIKRFEPGVEDGRYTARMTLPLGSDA